MNIMTMKKKDFEPVPMRESFCADIGRFDSLVIVPTKIHHASGFMCMDFIACKEGKPICRLSGNSDVLRIDGTGGYGKLNGRIPEFVAPKGWQIDCLPCGYLRLFGRKNLEVGQTLESFDVYAVSEGGD